jgi:hypothetical protein
MATISACAVGSFVTVTQLAHLRDDAAVFCDDGAEGAAAARAHIFQSERDGATHEFGRHGGCSGKQLACVSQKPQ